MFYLINVPVTKNDSLKKILEIQVCMVRMLSRLNLEMHQIITTEYLNIFEGNNSTKCLLENQSLTTYEALIINFFRTRQLLQR